MKSTTTTFVLLLGIALFVSCTEGPDPIVNNSAKTMQVQAEIASNFINPYVGESFTICGCATNCNLLNSPPSVKLSGIVSSLMSNGEFEVSDGELYVCSQSAGCHLIGHYEGTGIMDDYGVRLSALVFVDRGTGNFQADSGQLQLTVIGERMTNNQDEMNFNIFVNGYIADANHNFVY